MAEYVQCNSQKHSKMSFLQQPHFIPLTVLDYLSIDGGQRKKQGGQEQKTGALEAMVVLANSESSNRQCKV